MDSPTERMPIACVHCAKAKAKCDKKVSQNPGAKRRDTVKPFRSPWRDRDSVTTHILMEAVSRHDRDGMRGETVVFDVCADSGVHRYPVLDAWASRSCVNHARLDALPRIPIDATTCRELIRRGHCRPRPPSTSHSYPTSTRLLRR